MEAILSPIISPLLNLLFAFYALIPGHDFGVAVILLTAVIRLALWPLAKKQLIGQREMSKIQPEANRLKEKYGSDPQKYQAAVMELYKEKEINPFSSCFLLLIQLPFLFALFYVFNKFQSPAFVDLTNPNGILSQIYPFLKNMDAVKATLSGMTKIDTTLFGIIDLAKPYIPLAIAAAALQFVQTKMITPKKQEGDAASAMTSQMTYLFPILTVVIAYNLPAALPLYWSVTTLFAILQQYLVMRHDVEELEEKSERSTKKNGKAGK